MEREHPSILVIGAGAGGLAFALACAARGVKVRLIERRASRTLAGRATGVTLGVWRQLARFGITVDTVPEVIPMRRFVFFEDGQPLADVPVPTLGGEPPTYFYPQWSLELQLEKALKAHGVDVEYAMGVDTIEQTGEQATVRLFSTGDVTLEEARFDWVIGADGAHSDVRRITQLPFEGRDYPEKWSVAEVNTTQWPTDIQAQLHLKRGGAGLFLSQPSPGVVQGILNGPGAAAALTGRFADASLRYERNYWVSLRRVPTPRSGRIWLIGDAAHVQSPIGGQGLNLAIWDGLTLADALLDGDPGVEARLAGRARKVLAFTDLSYRLLDPPSALARQVRNGYWRSAARFPFVARLFFRVVSGI